MQTFTLVTFLLAGLVANAGIEMGTRVPIAAERFGSVDQIFVGGHFSQNWDMAGSSRVGAVLATNRVGVHPAGFVANRVLQAFQSTGPFAFLPPVDPQRSEIWIRTMNFGDPIITTLLLELKSLGLSKIKLIATGSDGFSVTEGRAEKFRQVDLKPDQGWMGAEAVKLIKAGFVVNPAKEMPFEILITSVNPNATIEDIMHEKATTLELRFKKEGLWSGFKKSLGVGTTGAFAPLLVDENGEKVFRMTLFLTDNFTPRKQAGTAAATHVFKQNLITNKDGRQQPLVLVAQPSPAQDMVLNRLFEVVLPELVKADHEHTKALGQAFRRTGKIGDIDEPNPPRTTFEFQDGSFLQLMYTNHTQNPFDREIELHQDVLEGKIKVREIIRSHFQDVNGAVLESLRKTLDFDHDIRAEFYYADDAVSPRKGVAAAYVGIPVRSNLGLHPGFSDETLNGRIDAQVYRRGETSGTGQGENLGKVLNHDKTTIYVTDEWTYVFTGTWNLSAHIENAEWQWCLKLRTGSDLAKYFINSIRSQKRLRPDLFEPLMKVVVMKAVTDYIGMDSDTVTAADIQDLQNDLARNNFASVIDKMRSLRLRGKPKEKKRGGDRRTDLRATAVSVDPEELETRLSILKNAFNTWRDAINAIRGNVTTTQDDVLSTVLNYAWVGVRRLSSGALDKLMPSFFDRGIFSDSQLVALLNGLNIERTRMHQLAKRESGVTNTSGFSRLRFFYAMTGGTAEVSEELGVANSLLLYNVVRESMGLPVEDKETFVANLQAEARKSPAERYRGDKAVVGDPSCEDIASATPARRPRRH